MSPRISITIPIYNGERFLEKTIASVIAQTFAAWELRLVDDGSRDGSLQIAQNFADSDPRIQVLHQENAGVAAARNRGYAATTSATQYVIFLDHDDVWEPDALEKLCAVLDERPEASAAYGLARAIDADGAPQMDNVTQAAGYERYGIRNGRREKIALEAETTFDVLAMWPCFQTPGQILLRRPLFEQVGGFDPQTEPSDEWELALRLSLLGPIRYVPEFVIRKRQHDSNAYNRRGYLNKGGPMIRRKMAGNHPLYAPHRAVSQRAHRIAVSLQFDYARTHLRRKNYRAAATQAYRAASDYLFYLKLR